MTKLSFDRFFKPGSVWASLIITCYFVAIFNGPVIRTIADVHGLTKPSDYLFMATAVIFLGIFINLVISLFAFRYSFKPWIIFLLISGAVASYYMETYHIWIDQHMLQNVIETDVKEVKDLLSVKLAMNLLLFGIVPSIIILKMPIQYQSTLRELLKKGAVTIGSGVSIGLISLAYYQDYASLFRNNRHLRDQIIPVDYVYAGYAFAHNSLSVPPGTLDKLGEDATLGPAWNAGDKMAVSLIVVGETARAANFSLGGYARETNPELEKQDIFYFPDFYSCGTATAVSVPCMFSNLGKKNYDDAVAKHSEGLLDVISHSQLAVLWRDNNSGCKGACDRVDYEDFAHVDDTLLCNTEECFDEVLLNGLEQKIQGYRDKGKKGVVVVMHQHGSHGPAYFQRVPPAFQKFTPYCHTNQIQECTREEIVNAYDNTILYTDHVLSRMIDFLKAHAQLYDASLFYMSDHGESLGEHNLYLHGLPYSMAPDEQIHIPALVWISDSYASRFHVDKSCLEREVSGSYSHDNLFHSMLGLLDIHTQAYDSSLDLFHPCQQHPDPA